MSVPELSFPSLVGKAEHHHLPWCFRSVRLFLFYHCGWRVGLEILSIGIKSSSSIRWCRSTAWMRILIPPHWPHAFYVDCPHLPSDLVVWSKLPSLDCLNVLYDGFHLPCNFWSRIVSPSLQTCIVMRLWVTIAKPTELSLVDNLVIIPCSIVHKTDGNLRPFDPPLHLCSSGPTRGMPSCHFPLNGFLKSLCW
jgi:hypothetical protein